MDYFETYEILVIFNRNKSRGSPDNEKLIALNYIFKKKDRVIAAFM